jgi:hypothetical protein
MLYDFHPEFTQMVDEGSTDDATSAPVITQTLVTANTYPAYSQVIASTPFDSYGLIIKSLSDEASTSQLYRTIGQVATGGSGSETNIIEGINFGQRRSNRGRLASRSMFFPVFIPSGTRLSFRAKSSLVTSSPRAFFGIYLFRQNSYPFNQWIGNSVTTYGIDDANLKASVDLTPGAGVDVWGSWTEITASTTRYHKALLFNIWANQAQTSNYQGYNVQFAVGGSGSESIISPTIRMCSPPEHLYQPLFQPTEHVESFVDIPAGSRISARVMTNNSTEQRTIGASFYGVS